MLFRSLVLGTPQSASAARTGETSKRVPAASSDHRIPSVFLQVLHNERQRDHVKKLEEIARAELRALLAKLIDAGGERDHTLEAEILGQVVYLQRLAIERGEIGVPPDEVKRFETENNDVVTTMTGGLAIGKTGDRPNPVHGAGFGTQSIVRGAPVAVMGADAGLFAVLGNVRSYVRRG